MSSSQVVFIMPAGEGAATSTLSGWGRQLLRLVLKLPNKVENVVELTGQVSRHDVESVLSRDVAGAMFFCHGKRNCLGNAGPLLELSNIHRCHNAVIVAIACHSAVELGHAAVSAGALSYLGFTDKLAWDPGEAQRFGDAIAQGLVCLFLGMPVQQAYTDMKVQFKEIEEYFKIGDGRSQKNSWICWMAAFWNAEHLIIAGASDVTLRRSQVFTAP